MNYLLRVIGPEVDHEILVAPSVRELLCGRDRNADIVLANDKFISRRHASLRNDGDSLTLRVISSTGVVSPRGTIPGGDSIQLGAGDEFSIGTYRLRVSAAGESALPAVPRTGHPSPSLDVRARSELVWKEPLPPIPDVNQAPTIRPSEPVVPMPEESPRSERPLGTPNPFDVLEPYRSSANGGGTLPPTPPEATYTNPPVPPREVAGLAHEPTVAPSVKGAPLWRSADLLKDLAPQGPFAKLLRPSDTPEPRPRLSPEHVHDFRRPYAPETTEPLPHIPSSPERVPPPAKDGSQIHPETAGDRWESFGRGLGLNFAAAHTQQAAEEAGRMVRQLVEVIADLQASRADLKMDLQIRDRTMVSGRDNNPFKWLSADEMIQYLFGEQAGMAFMPAERALRETLLELRVHEHAAASAARAAVEGALREFDPGLVSERLQEGSATSRFQFMASARLWNAYVAYFEKQSLQMADWLERIFSKYYSSTYFDESQRLKAADATPAFSATPRRPGAGGSGQGA